VSTQLDWAVGIGKESSYGAIASPTRFFETEAKMDHKITKTQGRGVRPGKALGSVARHAVTRREVSGDFDLDVTSKGFGMLLEAALGSYAESTFGDGFTPPGSLKLFRGTLAATDPMPSYTIWEVVPFIGGANGPALRFSGCVADSITFDLKPGGFLTAKVSWVGRMLAEVASAPATVYPAGDSLLGFTNAWAYLIDSSTDEIGPPGASGDAWPRPLGENSAALDVKEFSLTVKNNLDGEGFNLGGNGHRSRRPVLGKREVTGSLTVEFWDNRIPAWYRNQTPLSLCVNVPADDYQNNGLSILAPCVKLGGDTPKSNGGSPATLSVPFDVLDSPEWPTPLTVWYLTGDTAP
jgi:hypothetical protein